MNINEQIRKFRKQRGITAKFVAEKIGVSTALMSEIERGKCGISVNHLIALADFYNVSLDCLVGRNFDNRKSA